jgi:restriction system protein
MARNSSNGGSAEGWGLLIVTGLFLYFESTRNIGLFFLGSILIFIIAFFVWMHLTNRKEEAERLKKKANYRKEQAAHFIALASAKCKIIEIVGKHIEVLANRRDALVRVDRYGVVDGRDWNSEVQHFIEKVVKPMLTEAEEQAVALRGMSSVFQELVEERVAMHCKTRNVSRTISADTSPLDFEGMCAAVLRDSGWDAITTKGSGDQGADVVANFNGKKLVIQCKLYSGSVGNKAVQEILAAKHFYDADIAVVVCNSDYSKSARQLAQASGVEILTFDELDAFARKAAIAHR